MSLQGPKRRTWKLLVLATAALIVPAAVSIARAATVKTAGHLKLPPHTDVIVICNDPTVLTVLNQDFAAERRTLGNVTDTVTLTVTVNQKVMAPGVSLSEVFPGDPAMVQLLEEAGGSAPPLGDTGEQRIDPYAEAARRQAQGVDDDLTSAFRNDQAVKESMRGGGSSPYDSIPKNQIYDTVIIARANLGSLSGELKVLALIHGGDDAQEAKKMVGEEIANHLLH